MDYQVQDEFDISLFTVLPDGVHVPANTTFDKDVTFKGNVYGLDSLVLNANTLSANIISANIFIGNVTGNVVGDLTGNVTGNVVGDLTGNVTGNVVGDLTGNVTGNVVGDLTGNVTGHFTIARNISITGDASWNVSFDGSQDVSGSITLENINSSIGTFGNSSVIPVLSIDSKGRITSANTVEVSLGTSASYNVGTSGHVIPLLDGNNTWSGLNTFSGSIVANSPSFTNTISISQSGQFPTLQLVRNSVGVWTVGGTGVANDNTFSIRLNSISPFFTIDSLGVAKINGNTIWHAGNFNPSDYASLSTGPTFNGDVSVNDGTPTFAGYSSDHSTRYGYLLFANTGTDLNSDTGILRLVTGSVARATISSFGVSVNGALSATGAITQNGNQVWHTGNDGPGSGLDADLLDGHDSSYFMPINGGVFSGSVTINSSSVYSGTQTSGALSIYQQDGVEPLLVIGGDSNTSYFQTYGNRALNINALGNAVLIKGNTVWHAGNDGSGSGLDADKLDGLDSSQFLRSDVSDNMAGSLTIGSAAYLYRGTHSSGHLVGSYNNVGDNSLKTNPIYSIGNAYVPTDTSLSSMYGIGYTSGGAPFISFPGVGSISSDWGMYVASAGSATIFLDSSKGSVISTGDHYANGNLVTHAGNDGFVDGNVLRIPLPKGGSGYQSLSSVVGAIKITLPVFYTNTMLRFKVDIFQYGTGAIRTLNIAGYNYSGNNTWINVSATLDGDSHTDFNVRFGDDGTNSCIWIGELNSSWAYPSVRVVDFQASYSNYTRSTWESGWSIEFVTAFDTVKTTRTAGGNWNSGNDGSGSGLDADKLDGLDSTYFTRMDQTNLGRVGASGINSDTNTASEWSSLPIGYSAMMNATIGTAGGAPLSNYGYFTKVANRDTGGGWGGIWVGYGSGENYFGRTQTDTSLPTWDLIWTNSNDGSGSGLDADLLDGQQGSYYLSASNLTGTLPAACINGNYSFNSVTISQTSSNPGLNLSGSASNALAYFNYTGGAGGYIGLLQNGVRKGYLQTNSGYIRLASDEGGQLDIYGTADLRTSGYTIWHSGNDGSGSGLDADLLDGHDSTYFTTLISNVSQIVVKDTRSINDLPSALPNQAVSADFKYSSNVASPPVTSSGTYSHILTMKGWSNGGSGGFPAQLSFGDGLAIRQATSDSAWGPWRKLWHDGNDGPNSGLDADKLDGLDSTQFLRADTSDVVNGILTFGSGAYIGRASHSSGYLVGSYNNVGANSVDTNPIYVIGSNYMPTDTSLGNMYGIGFTSYQASFMSGLSNVSGWGLYVAAAGSAKIWLDGSTGVISSAGHHYVGGNVVWNAGNDGSGSGLDADLLDGQQGSYYLSASNLTGTLPAACINGSYSMNISTANNFTLNPADGNSLNFWGSSNSYYSIAMSSAPNATWGGRVSGETTSDYNMYFKMSAGTNRGFVFKNNSTCVAGIDGSGNFRNTGNIIAGGTVSGTSDVRLKKDIQPLESALDIVLSLEAVTYKWKKNNKNGFGYIAQDVKKVMPLAVNEDDDGTLSISYGNMVSIVTEAFKELYKEHQELKDRLNKLEKL